MFDDLKPTFHGRDLVTKLSAFMDLLDTILAGDADPAKVQIGTRAERVAFATPYTGLVWVETDYPALWRYTGSVWQYAGGAEALGRKNYLINGGFNVAQRGTIFTGATTPANNDDTFLTDRWCLLSNGNDRLDVSTPGVSFAGQSGYMSWNMQAAYQCAVVQFLEYRDTLELVGQLAALSFWAKKRATNVTAGTLRAAVLAWAGTADALTSDVVATWAGNGTEPTWAAGWTRAGITDPINLTTTLTRYKLENVSIPSGTNNVAVVIWLDDTNAIVGDVIDLSDVQLEKGGEVTTYEHRPYAQELALCRRYYWALKEADFNNPSAMVMGIQSSTTSLRFPIIFPVPMRVAPTAALTIGGLTVFAAGGSTAITGLSAALSGANGAQVDLAHAATGTAGNPAYLRGAGTTGQITFSAEL
ncbi:MAG: hypothetical protein KQJ78_20520 [Deltaproteobacteria bacterium]|nr:hypothetical protein [Deltaproteobacteria bacterium]